MRREEGSLAGRPSSRYIPKVKPSIGRLDGRNSFILRHRWLISSHTTDRTVLAIARELSHWAGDSATNKQGARRRLGMQDLIFVAITIAFFALSLGYVHFCDRVK
jgi:hypothetical protein